MIIAIIPGAVEEIEIEIYINAQVCGQLSETIYAMFVQCVGLSAQFE
jgi:hypothetical protein